MAGGPGYLYRFGWNGSDDLGATWQLAWNRSNLVLAVVVTDDVIVGATVETKEVQGDNLRLLLDTNVASEAAFGRDVYRITLLPGDLGRTLPLVRLAQGSQVGEFMPVSGPGTQIAVRPTKTGYLLEATIAYRLLFFLLHIIQVADFAGLVAIGGTVGTQEVALAGGVFLARMEAQLFNDIQN